MIDIRCKNILTFLENLRKFVNNIEIKEVHSDINLLRIQAYYRHPNYVYPYKDKDPGVGFGFHMEIQQSELNSLGITPNVFDFVEPSENALVKHISEFLKVSPMVWDYKNGGYIIPYEYRRTKFPSNHPELY